MTASRRDGLGWQVSWVTGVPNDWQVRRMRQALLLSNERNDDGSRADLLSLSVSRGIVPKVYDDQSQVRGGDELQKYFLVKPGQFVVNPMWLMHGSLGTASIHGVISPDYRVYDPAPGVDARYVHHLLKTREYQNLYGLLARGTTTYDRRISKDAFNDLPLLLPPLATQEAIADFLDQKTAAIDALIEKKQKLLDLLAEKRAAVINQAVFNGLDPNVRMKDSGIPWIGEVPVHWTWTRAKFLTSTISDCLHSTPDYLDEGFPALRTADVRPGWLNLQHARRVDEATLNERNQRLWPREGDVIYTREGGRFGIAAPVPHGVRLCLAQRVMLLRPSPKTDPQYLMWVLNSKSVFEQAVIETIGAASPRVNMETVANYVVPKPPREEQVAIAAHLTNETTTMASQADLLVRSQAKLLEYRQALITAAVTGQLDIDADAA